MVKLALLYTNQPTFCRCCGMQEQKLESVESELEQTRSDLQLAFKRIADLQATLEDEILHDSDEEGSDDR